MKQMQEQKKIKKKEQSFLYTIQTLNTGVPLMF